MGKSAKRDSAIRRNLSKRWYNLIDRCMNAEHKNYQTYGGNGVTVSSDWQDKEIFLTEVKKIPGYDEAKLLAGQIDLDKDTLVPGSKIYSSQTCSFIDSSANKKVKPNQQSTFVAVSPTGEVFSSDNQANFAREHNLRQSTICDCLNGKIKKHRGWTFSKV